MRPKRTLRELNPTLTVVERNPFLASGTLLAVSAQGMDYIVNNLQVWKEIKSRWRTNERVAGGYNQSKAKKAHEAEKKLETEYVAENSKNARKVEF